MLNQLDREIMPFHGTEKVTTPERGWIYTIRTKINMTLEQLGLRLNMTKQGIQKLEERESTGSITLNSLKEAGNALDMHFVYGFVPRQGSFNKLVEIKANQLAKKIVERTHQNMLLENQGKSEAFIEEAVEEMAAGLKMEMRRALWD